MGADRFSVRWTGSVTTAAAGLYQFRVLTDDGSYLLLNIGGADLIAADGFRDQGTTAYTSPLVFLDGSTEYPIRYDFYENGGDAVARLQWKKPGESDFQVIRPRT